MQDIIEKYEGHVFGIKFLQSRNLRMSPKGKHWPLTTQCVIYYNNSIIGIGEVVKHEDDPDNPKYAKVNSAKKAFNNLTRPLWKEIRTKLWEQILKS